MSEKNKWCEEPWPTFKETGEEKFVDLNQHNYDRAVECVNALTGIASPSEFVARARAIEAAAMEVLESVTPDEQLVDHYGEDGQITGTENVRMYRPPLDDLHAALLLPGAPQ